MLDTRGWLILLRASVNHLSYKTRCLRLNINTSIGVLLCLKERKRKPVL